MKKALMFLLGVLAAVSIGCGGTASCKEACEKTDDCQSGLGCYNILGYGMICVPDDCGTCFADDERCNWSEGVEDDEFTCSFNYCT